MLHKLRERHLHIHTHVHTQVPIHINSEIIHESSNLLAEPWLLPHPFLVFSVLCGTTSIVLCIVSLYNSFTDFRF